MPLDRRHITVASRIMLPTYAVFFAGLGLNYLFPGEAAAASPVLTFVNHLIPLEVWGGLFIFCAAIMVTALVRRSRVLYRWALRVCGFSMLFWATFVALATLAGDATPFSVGWSLFIATCCLASDRSLAAREV